METQGEQPSLVRHTRLKRPEAPGKGRKEAAMYRKILVGCHGSDHAEDALALAVLVAAATGASLSLVCAIHRVPAYFQLEREDEFRDWAKGILDQAAARLPAGISSELVVQAETARPEKARVP